MLIWTTNGEPNDPPCALCQALAGKPSGQGWDNELGPEVDLWQRNPETGEYERTTDSPLSGGPPLHPHCRCTITVITDPW